MSKGDSAKTAAGHAEGARIVAPDTGISDDGAAAARTAKRSNLIALSIAIVSVLCLVAYALSQPAGSDVDSHNAGAAGAAGDGAGGASMDDNANAPTRPECPAPTTVGKQTAGAAGQGEDTAPAGAAGQEGAAQLVSAQSPLRDIHLPCLGAPHQGEIPMAEALAGKPTLLNVWAWNCAPCRKELPLLEQWAAKHPEFNMVGVQAATSAGRGAAFMNEIGVNVASYQDTHDTIGSALALPRVVPVTVVLRADGTVAKYFAKEFTTEAEVDAAMQEALA